MPIIDEKEVRQVVEHITDLQKSIKTRGEEGRTRLQVIPVDASCQNIRDSNGKFLSEGWTKVKEQDKLHLELLQIRDSLQAASELDGPPDKGHVMYATYASTEAIYACAALGGILTVALLCVIGLQWDKALNADYAEKINAAATAVTHLKQAEDEAKKAAEEALAAQGKADEEKKASTSNQAATGPDNTTPNAPQTVPSSPAKNEAQTKLRLANAKEQAKEQALQAASLPAIEAIKTIIKNEGAKESTVLQMIMLLGALGGTLHLVGSLVNYVGDRKLRRSWLLYYFALPFVGAALAPIVYMLLRVGILTPTGQGNGGTAIANLNLISIYGFAALTGMFAKVATEKLGDVFTAMFQPRPERVMGDTLSSDKTKAS